MIFELFEANGVSPPLPRMSHRMTVSLPDDALTLADNPGTFAADGADGGLAFSHPRPRTVSTTARCGVFLCRGPLGSRASSRLSPETANSFSGAFASSAWKVATLIRVARELGDNPRLRRYQSERAPNWSFVRYDPDRLRFALRAICHGRRWAALCVQSQHPRLGRGPDRSRAPHVVMALLVAGCGGGLIRWHRLDPTPLGRRPPNQQLEIWSGGKAVHWHAVVIGGDSVSGIPHQMPVDCDSCRSNLAWAEVDSILRRPNCGEVVLAFVILTGLVLWLIKMPT